MGVTVRFLGRLMVVMISGDQILIVWLEFRIPAGGEIVVVRPGEVVAWMVMLLGCFPQKEELRVTASGGLLITRLAGGGGWWFWPVGLSFFYGFFFFCSVPLLPIYFPYCMKYYGFFLIEFLDW